MPRVGMLLYGYCNGYFGRDSYDTKRVEAFGEDWVVARSTDGQARPEFASFKTHQELCAYLEAWSGDKVRQRWDQ